MNHGRYTLQEVECTIRSFCVPAVRGEESYVERVWNMPVDLDLFQKLAPMVKYIGVTQEFKDVIDYFKVPEKETPAGFRIAILYSGDGVLQVDLVRDISYDKNGKKRPTNLLLSADTANPYDLQHMAKLVCNLTCNPSIIYDRFINNPEANYKGEFKTREEVMTEILQYVNLFHNNVQSLRP